MKNAAKSRNCHCEPKVAERSRRILESATMIAAESRTCHCEPKVTERSRSGGVAIQNVCHPRPTGGDPLFLVLQLRRASLLVALLLAFFLAVPAAAADKLDKLDSARMTTLNMTDEQIAEVYGIDSTKLVTGPTLQELNEENPSYVKREYDHKQQVIVGSVVMFCVTLAMILMNNYNPKR